MEANTSLCSTTRDLQLELDALRSHQDDLEWQNHHLSSCTSVPWVESVSVDAVTSETLKDA
eukprot:8236231-Karenia_brevis.AAC.1